MVQRGLRNHGLGVSPRGLNSKSMVLLSKVRFWKSLGVGLNSKSMVLLSKSKVLEEFRGRPKLEK